MPKGTRVALILGLVLAALPGCAVFERIGFAPQRPDPEAVKAPPGREEPSRVTVQHVLVSFQEAKKVPGCTRTKDEAQRLAERVLRDAKAGRNFDELVELYSDDRPGAGTIPIANWGVSARRAEELERRALAPGFGRAAFALEVGQVGLVPYDESESPYGWHIVKRVQ